MNEIMMRWDENWNEQGDMVNKKWVKIDENDPNIF